MSAESLRYATTHEWVAASGDVATIGVTEFAVKLLTDIVFLQLPKVGRKVRQGESIGEIESVKAVSDLYAPVDGEVVEVNSELPDNLGLLTDSPYDKAWIARIRMSQPGQVDQLLDYRGYTRHCDSAGH